MGVQNVKVVLTVFPLERKTDLLQIFLAFKSKYETLSLNFAILVQLGSKSIALVFNCAKTTLIGKDEVFLDLL